MRTPFRFRRTSPRHPDHDYTTPGLYFFTTVVQGRAPILAEVREGWIILTDAGRIVADCLETLPQRMSDVSVDTFVVMPDHVHAILQFGAPHVRLSSVVGQIKGASARFINAHWGCTGGPVWQRGYYDRIIRNSAELALFRVYIAENPARWLTRNAEQDDGSRAGNARKRHPREHTSAVRG